MIETGAAHVWLDAREFGPRVWEERFPTILASCRAHGIDPVTELIPVSPASHYVSGGVRTDLDGRASIPGLYACGEVACTGVHGANRLASNSLLEGLVFAARIGRALAGDTRMASPLVPLPAAAPLISGDRRRALQQAMSDHVSVLRSAESLHRASRILMDMANGAGGVPCTDDWETTNLHTVAWTLIHHALIREETRGSHWREDFPERNDEMWRVRLVSRLSSGVDIDTRHMPVQGGGPRGSR